MKIHDPATIDEALDIKRRYPGAVPLAGGTDLLPLWSSTGSRPDRVVLLGSCAALRGIGERDGDPFIGACATHSEISEHDRVARHFRALAEAARSIGAPAIRNMGTLGGNLANASPAADLPPALIVCGAEAVLASAERGERTIPVEDFFLSYKRTALEKDELLLGIRLEVPDPGVRSFFEKVGTRKAQALAKLSVALSARIDAGRIGSVRIAAGSVAPVPLRLKEVEARIEGNKLSEELIDTARTLAASALSPIDDVRSTARYRRFVFAALLGDCLDRMRMEEDGR